MKTMDDAEKKFRREEIKKAEGKDVLAQIKKFEDQDNRSYLELSMSGFIPARAKRIYAEIEEAPPSERKDLFRDWKKNGIVTSSVIKELRLMETSFTSGHDW